MSIIGLSFLGGLIGIFLGGWYGTVTDKSDFPIYSLFTIPVGGMIGGFVGTVIGVIFFA